MLGDVSLPFPNFEEEKGGTKVFIHHVSPLYFLILNFVVNTKYHSKLISHEKDEDGRCEKQKISSKITHSICASVRMRDRR